MRRFAYALLALIWIAGIWIWLHPAPDAPAPAPLPPSVPALESAPGGVAKLEAPAPPRKLPSARQRQRMPAPSGEATPAIVRVRSSVGLPLLWVEVSLAGEAWQEVDLPESGLEVEPDAYPLRVRAAGHLEADAARGAAEIVLEPDALLTVESPSLRTRARNLETLRGSSRSPRQSGVLAEFPDADHLLFAFSPARLAAFHSGDVDLAFSCPDGRPVAFVLHPIRGLRAHYVLPPDDLGGTAPLDVEIVDEGERPGHISLWLAELGAPQQAAAREEFVWGSVSIGAREVPAFPDPLWGRASRARVEGLALERSYALCALDDNEHYGRIEFVHDGSERKIVLQTPYTIVGRALDAENAAGLLRPDVRAYPLGQPEDPDWFARGGPCDELGGFELHVPGFSWGRKGGLPPIEAPERFTVVVSAEGHRSVELQLEWGGKRRVDLGAIALARSLAPILIDASDFLVAPWTDLRAFTFSGEPALEWTLRHAVARPDGDHELELAYAAADTAVIWRDLVSGESGARPFVTRNGDLLLLRAGDEALAYRRSESGPYQLIPRSMHQVSVECPKLPESGAWTLGWRGGGTWAGFRTVTKPGAVAEWILLPELATELWWSAGEAPPELCKKAGGVLALSPGQLSLVLR